ncbi:putative U1 small nuclear ribonucleoprotein [Lindgomyces ingoldianus]|uniref:U1 small nuclear ribonucleoprotein n=1 Tax=Lindgomyces ingoldianus TaxID=673940 RepID=A0ACB6R4D5_9PLEO|nr:putative U1 small nuclear ribonucleoprotein [Lindgomyces ingoldianus]KAF2473927.1 putative U1 small nuclear ribonucleoprotein [Lindgomyces ingoldianus]
MEKMEGVVYSANGLPISTLYVNNLYERAEVDFMVEAMRTIFQDFGEIVDIVMKKSLYRKGQAFIVFTDPASVSKAMTMQGFPLFDKPMHLAPAKTVSDATVKQKGNDDQLETHVRKRKSEKERKQAKLAAEAQKNASHAPGATEPSKPRPAKSAAAVIPDEYLPPNKILFLQNIPSDVDADELTIIFERFPGFKEVRSVPMRAIAFAEYDTEQNAITAKEATAGMTIGAEQKQMKVTYQRK